MDIRSAQTRAWANKVAKGFNTTDVPLEFCLLQGEIAEAFEAWRTGREDVGEELADVAIYLLGLAEMTGVDLQGQVEAKIAKNATRTYRCLPNGALAKNPNKADGVERYCDSEYRECCAGGRKHRDHVDEARGCPGGQGDSEGAGFAGVPDQRADRQSADDGPGGLDAHEHAEE